MKKKTYHALTLETVHRLLLFALKLCSLIGLALSVLLLLLLAGSLLLFGNGLLEGAVLLLQVLSVLLNVLLAAKRIMVVLFDFLGDAIVNGGASSCNELG